MKLNKRNLTKKLIELKHGGTAREKDFVNRMVKCFGLQREHNKRWAPFQKYWDDIARSYENS